MAPRNIAAPLAFLPTEKIAKLVERSLLQCGFAAARRRQNARFNARASANSGHAQKPALRHDLEIDCIAALPLGLRRSAAVVVFRRHV